MDTKRPNNMACIALTLAVAFSVAGCMKNSPATDSSEEPVQKGQSANSDSRLIIQDLGNGCQIISRKPAEQGELEIQPQISCPEADLRDLYPLEKQ